MSRWQVFLPHFLKAETEFTAHQFPAKLSSLDWASLCSTCFIHQLTLDRHCWSGTEAHPLQRMCTCSVTRLPGDSDPKIVESECQWSLGWAWQGNCSEGAMHLWIWWTRDHLSSHASQIPMLSKQALPPLVRNPLFFCGTVVPIPFGFAFCDIVYPWSTRLQTY